MVKCAAYRFKNPGTVSSNPACLSSMAFCFDIVVTYLGTEHSDKVYMHVKRVGSELLYANHIKNTVTLVVRMRQTGDFYHH